MAPPTIPLRSIAEDAIRRFEDPALTDLTDLEHYAIPWVSEHMPASAPRPRHVSITFKRALEIGPTLTCRGCCGESPYHTKSCRERLDAHYGPKPAESEAPRAPDPHETLELPPPQLRFQERGSSSSGSAAPPPAAPELAFATPASGGSSDTADVDAQGAVLQSRDIALATSTDAADEWTQGFGQGEAPDGEPPHEDAVAPPAPAYSDSQELALVLGELKIRTDKARLEDQAELLRSSACVNYGSAARRPAVELNGSKTAALAAVTESYKCSVLVQPVLEHAIEVTITDQVDELLIRAQQTFYSR